MAKSKPPAWLKDLIDDAKALSAGTMGVELVFYSEKALKQCEAAMKGRKGLKHITAKLSATPPPHGVAPHEGGKAPVGKAPIEDAGEDPLSIDDLV